MNMKVYKYTMYNFFYPFCRTLVDTVYSLKDQVRLLEQVMITIVLVLHLHVFWCHYEMYL